MDNQELATKDEILKQYAMYSKGKLKWKIESLPEEILQTSAEELEKQQKITDTDRKLRLQLHQEISDAMADDRKVVMNRVCDGVCHINHFLKLIEDPKKLGWYLLPYQHEQTRVKHQVVLAQDSVDQLLNIPIYNKDGTLNIKAADLKFKVTKMIYDRAYPAKKVVEWLQRNGQLPEGEDEKIENIESKIKLLEQELGEKRDDSE